MQNRRGTTVTFHPDPQIFGEDARFRPATLFRMARSKAYLFRGMEIRWSCPAELVADDPAVPSEAVLRFPGGVGDHLARRWERRPVLTPEPFAGEAEMAGGAGRLEWAVAWPLDEDGFHVVLQYRADAAGRHTRGGLSGGADPGVKAYGELVKIATSRTWRRKT